MIMPNQIFIQVCNIFETGHAKISQFYSFIVRPIR